MNTASQIKNGLNAPVRHLIAGGTYLVVADRSEEFCIALQHAAALAKANGCHVGILVVLEDQGIQHWGGIEERMKHEQREDAERMLWSIATQIEERGYSMPAFYVEEGNPREVLARLIEDDPNISKLILGAGSQGNGPGPLVSYFTGKGLSRLRVPVLIVPEHLAHLS